MTETESVSIVLFVASIIEKDNELVQEFEKTSVT